MDKQDVNRSSGRANRTESLMGFLGLPIGVRFYFLERPKGTANLQTKLPHADRTFPYTPNLLGRVTGSFPSFLHAFSFSLIRMGLISQTGRPRILVCSMFLVLHPSFETGQRYKDIAVWVVPGWLRAIIAMVNTESFCAGFSASDLMASCLGSLAALSVKYLRGTVPTENNELLSTLFHVTPILTQCPRFGAPIPF
jgi:hypothetical protein